jgi:hypothetical protein
MKTIILTIFLLIAHVSFGQLDTNEVLEPVAFTKACLEVAIIPKPDTLESYPNETIRFTKLIDQYLVTLRPKLKEEDRKQFEEHQYLWEVNLEVTLFVTNKIIQDNSLPLLTRRQSAIQQFKYLEKRTLYLRKLIASA